MKIKIKLKLKNWKCEVWINCFTIIHVYWYKFFLICSIRRSSNLWRESTKTKKFINERTNEIRGGFSHEVSRRKARIRVSAKLRPAFMCYLAGVSKATRATPWNPGRRRLSALSARWWEAHPPAPPPTPHHFRVAKYNSGPEDDATKIEQTHFKYK